MKQNKSNLCKKQPINLKAVDYVIIFDADAVGWIFTRVTSSLI